MSLFQFRKHCQLKFEHRRDASKRCILNMHDLKIWFKNRVTKNLNFNWYKQPVAFWWISWDWRKAGLLLINECNFWDWSVNFCVAQEGSFLEMRLEIEKESIVVRNLSVSIVYGAKLFNSYSFSCLFCWALSELSSKLQLQLNSRRFQLVNK